MGEYVKYGRESVKIGTCEDLYYTSYQKFTKLLEAGRLKKDEGSLEPAEYVKPDSGDRFRFPFPDEDQLRFGEINGAFNRGLAITLSSAEAIGKQPTTTPIPDRTQIEIIQQKLLHRQSDGKLVLALVCRDPIVGNAFRLEDECDIRPLLKGLTRNHLISEQNEETRKFYREIASRILKGYRLDFPGLNQQIAQGKPQQLKLSYPKRKKGFGI